MPMIFSHLVDTGAHHEHGQVEEAEAAGRYGGHGLQVLLEAVDAGDQPLCHSNYEDAGRSKIRRKIFKKIS
jgi:hypothetical protein